MNKTIDNLRKIRQLAFAMTEQLTAEMLNKIPEGFNNNILWNLGHMVAAQEGICYRRCGMPLNVPDHFFERYKPGSKPENDANAAEIALVRGLLVSSLDKLEADYAAGKLVMTPWTTRYGVEINTIEDGINFLQFHEGLHIGVISALTKLVK
jgi:hypothetical protein